MGDAYTEAELLLSRSPITYVDRIRAPLHGSSIGPGTQSQA
jgi:dipeptidyl aminopeptidase/acylaminoacyl peptidase